MKDQINTIREALEQAKQNTTHGQIAWNCKEALAALAQIEAAAGEQEPKFWYRPVGNDGLYEGPVHNNSIGGKMLRDEKPGEWVPLFEGPAPVAKQPQADPHKPLRPADEADKAVYQSIADNYSKPHSPCPTCVSLARAVMMDQRGES